MPATDTAGLRPCQVREPPVALPPGGADSHGTGAGPTSMVCAVTARWSGRCLRAIGNPSSAGHDQLPMAPWLDAG